METIPKELLALTTTMQAILLIDKENLTDFLKSTSHRVSPFLSSIPDSTLLKRFLTVYRVSIGACSTR